jgi:hypothetical protein
MGTTLLIDQEKFAGTEAKPKKGEGHTPMMAHYHG